MFGKITLSLKNAVNKLRVFDDEKALKKVLDELRKSLLKADVHHKVVKELVSTVFIQTKKAGIGKDNFLKILAKNLTAILEVKGNKGFVFSPTPPTIILFCGLQGSGKTTTVGK